MRIGTEHKHNTYTYNCIGTLLPDNYIYIYTCIYTHTILKCRRTTNKGGKFLVLRLAHCYYIQIVPMTFENIWAGPYP